MVTVTFNSQNMSPQQLDDIKSTVKDHFADQGVTSLYFLASEHSTGYWEKPELLAGEECLVETFRGNTFRIGPQSFFQSNLAALDNLVDTVYKHLKPAKNKVLLDLCCGVGLYGLTFAKDFKHVHGLDVSPGAVADAEANAERNGITNADFYHGKLEQRFDELMEELEKAGESLSVVLNPGRNGVSPKAVQRLRQSRRVKRIVYVSCQPEGKAFDNLVLLCRADRSVKAKNKGIYAREFQLSMATPVDMFPGTHCCEHVFVLDR